MADPDCPQAVPAPWPSDREISGRWLLLAPALPARTGSAIRRCPTIKRRGGLDPQRHLLGPGWCRLPHRQCAPTALQCAGSCRSPAADCPASARSEPPRRAAPTASPPSGSDPPPASSVAPAPQAEPFLRDLLTPRTRTVLACLTAWRFCDARRVCASASK